MGIFDFPKEKNKRNDQSDKENKRNTDELTNQIRQFSDNFVTDSAGRINGQLDYSVESLKLVDEYLDDASDFIYDNQKAIESIAVAVGSYILEVARRNYGGVFYWYAKLDQPILVTGQPDFEISLVAIEKVKGRIINGSDDNIPFFFDGYIKYVNKGKSEPGLVAMIV